ncbi:MAG: hypothetical protein ABJK37_09335 [Paraglaciecola sp.]
MIEEVLDNLAESNDDYGQKRVAMFLCIFLRNILGRGRVLIAK